MMPIRIWEDEESQELVILDVAGLDDEERVSLACAVHREIQSSGQKKGFELIYARQAGVPVIWGANFYSSRPIDP